MSMRSSLLQDVCPITKSLYAYDTNEYVGIYFYIYWYRYWEKTFELSLKNTQTRTHTDTKSNHTDSDYIA